METFINILEIIAFILKAILGMSVIVLVAMVGTYVHDEIKEVMAERSIELAKNREELRQLKTEDATVFTEWVGRHRADTKTKAKHRLNRNEVRYTHAPDDTYLIWASDRKKYEPLPNDNSWVEALLKEQKEMAPLWT